jgi:hypothetical protein
MVFPRVPRHPHNPNHPTQQNTRHFESRYQRKLFFLINKVLQERSSEYFLRKGSRAEFWNCPPNIELIENIVAATNQSKGSVLAVLSELDVQLESGLKSGRIVHLPNGTHFEPIGKKDGTVDIGVRVNPDLDKVVNSEFRGTWANSENIGKTEDEIVSMWNSVYPTDLITLD